MIGYAPSTAAEDQGSRFGAGAVMLAVDELALRVAKNDSATALSRHDPVRPMERRSPSSVTDVHAAAELNSLPRSVKKASTSATTRWQGELWGGSGPGGCRVGEHSEGELLSVAVVAESCSDRRDAALPPRSISFVER
jgi:hypothetical protein